MNLGSFHVMMGSTHFSVVLAHYTTTMFAMECFSSLCQYIYIKFGKKSSI
jgi:hypothetical protein